IFHNRFTDNGGALGFRDVSSAVLPGPDWAPGTGSYEQELGDLDQGGDLDLYGVNWSNVCDVELLHDGSGAFPIESWAADSAGRQNEADVTDYDNDGLLDGFTGSRTAAEELYHSLGAAGGWVLDPVTTELPPIATQTLGCDACDIDLDGDYDLFL